jgi:hypothetical protein
MKSCDYCERDIPDYVAVCPYCNKRQMSADQRLAQTRRIFVVVTLTLGLFICFALFQYLFHGVVPHFQ